MLHIQAFLHEHPTDWKQLLVADPYNLFIREKDGLVLFMYNQIDSCFDLPLVCECRGIILDGNDFSIRACGFYKFWNVQETRAVKIDWPTAKVLTKIDGSIIKIFWYRNEWRLSTMSMIDARECTLQNNLDPKYQTFYDLFMEAARKNNLDFNRLNKKHTTVFELVSPYNRVVIPYKDFDIYHLTTRDNETLQELDIDIGIQKPKAYSFNSIEDVLTMAQTLPFSEEGYVVVDGNYNRVKIKSPAYLQIHHLHNNGNMNKDRVLWLIMHGEHKEYLAIFPEYKKFFDEIEDAFNVYLNKIRKDITVLTSQTFTTKKDYAMVAKEMTAPSLMFLMYDKKVTIENWEKYIRSLPAEKVIDYLGINKG